MRYWNVANALRQAGLGTQPMYMGGQVRKGISAPYVAHLLAVAATVLEYGGDEDLAIAALLHGQVRGSWKPARIVSPIRAKGSARHIGKSERKLISRTCEWPTSIFYGYRS